MPSFPRLRASRRSGCNTGTAHATIRNPTS